MCPAFRAAALRVFLCVGLLALLFCFSPTSVRGDWTWQYVDDFRTQKAGIASYDHAQIGGTPGLNGYLSYTSSPQGLEFVPPWDIGYPEAYMKFAVPFADAPGPITSGNLQVQVTSRPGESGGLFIEAQGGGTLVIGAPGTYDLALPSGASKANINFVGSGLIVSKMTITLSGQGDQLTIGAVKGLKNGTSVSLMSRVVSRRFINDWYLQDPDRTAGIRVDGLQYAQPADHYDVIGTIETQADERFISGGASIPLGVFDAPAPLAVSNRSLGGGSMPNIPGVTGGVGLSNLGLLVTTTGEFSYVDFFTFTITDGSGVPVKCIVSPDIYVDPYWQYLTVTGISCLEDVGGNKRERVLKIPLMQDITQYYY